MAILGGAGNPVGGSFTGPAQALEIIGDHCYAYSGFSTFTNAAEVSLLEFTSGNFYSVVEITPMRNDTDSADSSHKMYLNDSLVAVLQNASGTEMGRSGFNEALIAPYTKFKMTVIMSSSATGQGGVMLAGRIYRTRD
tara:strand:- start:57 stop:470 length:414 start_codon:yes stop_codon:yes gene_type:complete